jgi:hypothetical protein
MVAGRFVAPVSGTYFFAATSGPRHSSDDSMGNTQAFRIVKGASATTPTGAGWIALWHPDVTLAYGKAEVNNSILFYSIQFNLIQFNKRTLHKDLPPFLTQQFSSHERLTLLRVAAV